MAFFITDCFFHVSVVLLRFWMETISEQRRSLTVLGVSGGHTVDLREKRREDMMLCLVVTVQL